VVDGAGLRWALFISSAIFALLHLANPGSGAASTIGLLAAGYFLAFAWLRTGRLWLSIGLHIGWNFFEGTVFGFQVSGLEPFALMRHTPSGPAWAVGGAFGPEAGGHAPSLCRGEFSSCWPIPSAAVPAEVRSGNSLLTT
jgi:hypothetical protein